MLIHSKVTFPIRVISIFLRIFLNLLFLLQLAKKGVSVTWHGVVVDPLPRGVPWVLACLCWDVWHPAWSLGFYCCCPPGVEVPVGHWASAEIPCQNLQSWDSQIKPLSANSGQKHLWPLKDASTQAVFLPLWRMQSFVKLPSAPSALNQTPDGHKEKHFC